MKYSTVIGSGNYFFILMTSIVLIASCHSPSIKKKSSNHFDSLVVASFKSDSITASQIDRSNNGDIDPNAFASLYVVAVDTSKSYETLHFKMITLQKSLHLSVDTLGRYYNQKKNLIALPDSTSDELYGGSYFPRRYSSINLSLEYLDAYTSVAGSKTIVLVAGIFEHKESADSLVKLIQGQEEGAFYFPSLIYEGCVH